LQVSPASLDLDAVRLVVALGVVGLWLALARFGVARADELSDLEKAYGAYAAHKYVDAEARLRALLDPRTGTLKDPDRVADARMYLGAVLLAEGRRADALAVFQMLLIDKEDYQPDPLRLPLEALDALIDVRSQIREQVRALQVERARQRQDEQAKVEAEKQRAAARLAVLEKLAGEEIVTERHSRWIALVPFGVGQFQNRQQTLGWTFLIGESLLLTGSAISAGLTLYNQGNANDALRNQDCGFSTQPGACPRAEGFHQRALGDWYADVAFSAGFVALALVDVIHAQLTFVPAHVEVKRRSLPPLSLAPVVGPGVVGLVAKF
jgi:hypothetical protein